MQLKEINVEDSNKLLENTFMLSAVFKSIQVHTNPRNKALHLKLYLCRPCVRLIVGFQRKIHCSVFPIVQYN